VSIKEAQSEIRTLTGIKRSETQLRHFPKKPTALPEDRDDPAKAVPDVQAAYFKKALWIPYSLCIFKC